MAGQFRAGHAASDDVAQKHHHIAGGGHCVPGHGHQSARGRGLGDDAELLRTPLYAGAGEAGEV